VGMVGLLQLILNDDHAVIGEITAKKIEGETINRLLRHVKLKVHAEQFGENIDVLQ